MSTKSLLLVAALLASGSTAALAGEGNGNPFPFRAAPLAEQHLVRRPFDVGAQQYPAANPALAEPMYAEQMAPQLGSQGEVASLNSLPRNAEVGTVQYARAQELGRWFAHRSALAQAGRGVPHG